MSNCLILADHIYQDTSGKYIIAGTYTAWSKRISGWEQAVFDAPHGLAIYGRFSPERFGDMTFTIAVKDSQREDWNESWLRTKLNVHINPGDHLPGVLDFHLRTPPFSIQPNIRQPPVNGKLRLSNTIDLILDGEIIASTPLDIFFQLNDDGEE